MSLFVDVLAWAAIACAAAGAAAALASLAAGRAEGQPARPGTASVSWRTVRLCAGVILLSCIRWTGGAVTWLVLAAGIWLVLVWDLASWLRTRYRLTRAG